MCNSVLNRAMAAAVLRMRGVEGEPLDFAVYPGTISVIAPDARKFVAGLAAVREFIEGEQESAADRTDEDGHYHVESPEVAVVASTAGSGDTEAPPEAAVGAAKGKGKGKGRGKGK